MPAIDAWNLAIGLGGAAIGVVGTYVVYRLQRRAERRLAHELGQFRAPRLELSVSGGVWEESGVEKVTWWHALEHIDDEPRLQNVEFAVRNVGEMVARDVILRVRVPLLRGVADATQTVPDRLGPPVEVRRRRQGHFVVAELYAQSLPPGQGLSITEMLVLKPTQLDLEVENLNLSLTYGTLVTADVTSEAGTGPHMDLAYSVHTGSLMEVLAGVTPSIDKHDRKNFGVDRSRLLKPLRWYRYITERPAVTGAERYYVSRHDMPPDVREVMTHAARETLGGEAGVPVSLEDVFRVYCSGAAWYVFDVAHTSLHRVGTTDPEPRRRWSVRDVTEDDD